MRRRGFLSGCGAGIVAAGFPFLRVKADPAAGEAVVDRLGAPGPYTVRGVEYRLAWTSQPTPQYAKHEYVPEGQTPERFERMLLLEYAAGADPVKAAAGKVEELKARKPNDPTTNWAILRNAAAGEILIDFTLSAPTPDGGGVSEWNAYRYTTGPGGKGVVLFGLSRRAYGADRVQFYKSLKQERPIDIKALAELPMPLVKPAKG